MLHLSSCPLNLLSLVVAQFWVHKFILFYLILTKQCSSVAIVSHLINGGCWLFAVTAKENYWIHLSLEYLTLPVMSKYNFMFVHVGKSDNFKVLVNALRGHY
jgi:apolipoprotein N-acyltransferase